MALIALTSCKSDDKTSAAAAAEVTAALDGPAADASGTEDAVASERRAQPETRPAPPTVDPGEEPEGTAPKEAAAIEGDASGVARPAPPSVAPRDGLVPRGTRPGVIAGGASDRGVHPARLAGGDGPTRPEPMLPGDAPLAGAEVEVGEGEAAAPPRDSAPAVLAPRGPGEPTRPPGAGVPVTPSPVRPAPPSVASRPLDVERYLPLERVREIVDERRVMPTGPLVGLEAGPGYNSIHYSVPGKDGLGVAVQVWQDANRRDVNERFQRMKAQYPNATDIRTLEPTNAFYSWFGQVQTLTFFDTNKLVVVSVSCGEAACSQQQLLKLAKQAQSAM